MTGNWNLSGTALTLTVTAIEGEALSGHQMFIYGIYSGDAITFTKSGSTDGSNSYTQELDSPIVLSRVS